MKLLIVDDEPIIREGIKSLVDLSGLGIKTIYEASNGEKALEIFNLYLPDIVLADINMPRMNGLEFSERIKQTKPEVKIALITGYDYFDYARQAIKIGVEDYILKPVSKSDITSLLASLVAKVKTDEEQKRLQEIIKKQTGAKIENQEAQAMKGSDYKHQIQSFLDQHIYDEELSLQLIAETLILSSGYLSGLFKKEFGLSFKEYVLSKRLDQAKILMLSTDMKNYEVSEAIGLKDANYFSAMFKKHTGMSPNKYREGQK